MDTLPSGELQVVASDPPWLVSGFRFRARLGFVIPSTFSSPRGITPAFGYGAPHSSARGTLTLLSNALLSAHYGAVRLLLNVHVRRSVYHLRGPVLIFRTRRPGDLPVLVHVVSQRARVLRLRRTGWTLASNAANRVAFPVTSEGRHPETTVFRSSIARPTDTSIYASSATSRCRPQDSRPGWIRCSPFL
jgi:hypothetical protein